MSMNISQKQQVSFGTKINFSKEVRKGFPTSAMITEQTGQHFSLLDTLRQGLWVVVPEHKYHKGDKILDYIADKWFKNDGKKLELNLDRVTKNGLDLLRATLKDKDSKLVIDKRFGNFCDRPYGTINNIVQRAANFVKKH
jgi:hypothetical protein